MRNSMIVMAISILFSASSHAVDIRQTIAAAELTDPTLASALSNKDAARENIAIARSRILPQVAAVGTYSRTQQNVESTNVLGVSSRNYSVNGRNEQINLRQGLLRPKDWIGLTIGELQASYGEQKLYAAQSDLWYRAIAAWVDYVAAIENQQAQEQALIAAERAAQQAQKRYQAGDGTKDVAAEAKAQAELAKALFAEARANFLAKKHAYDLLTGNKINSFPYKSLPTYQSLQLPEKVLDVALNLAVEVNPEILASKAAEEINNRRLSQAKYDHLPTVDLVSSYSKSNNDTLNTLNTRYTNAQVGVQISIPIFTGGQLSAVERQSAAYAQAAKADKEAAEYRVRNQLVSDWNAYEATIDRVKASEALSDAAKEQKRAMYIGLKSGVRSWADVASAEIQLAKREADRIAYLGSYFKIQARLLANYPVQESYWDRWLSAADRIKR